MEEFESNFQIFTVLINKIITKDYDTKTVNSFLESVALFMLSSESLPSRKRGIKFVYDSYNMICNLVIDNIEIISKLNSPITLFSRVQRDWWYAINSVDEETIKRYLSTVMFKNILVLSACFANNQQNQNETSESAAVYVITKSLGVLHDNLLKNNYVIDSELWKLQIYAEKGFEISIEDCCKLSPQTRVDFINTKVMDTIEDNDSIEWRLKAVEQLYSVDEDGNKCIHYYGNREGKCMLICDTDGAKLRNIEELEKGEAKLQTVIMAYAKTNSTSTSGQLMDKYTMKNDKKAEEILAKLYEKSLDEEVTKKVNTDFDMEASFNDISAGETPDILEACPIEYGLCLFSFCLASKLIPFIPS